MNESDIANKLLIDKRDIRVISEQNRTGVKKALNRKWGSYLKRYRRLPIPVCCEFCSFVGEAMWHCHCATSPKNHINVMPWNVCSEWEPNIGLIMYLCRRKTLIEKEKHIQIADGDVK